MMSFNRSGTRANNRSQQWIRWRSIIVLEKAVRSGWSGMRVNVWVFLAMLIVSEVFHIMNLLASVSHPGWLAVHAALTGVTLGFFVFGLGVLRALAGSRRSRRESDCAREATTTVLPHYV